MNFGIRPWPLSTLLLMRSSAEAEAEEELLRRAALLLVLEVTKGDGGLATIEKVEGVASVVVKIGAAIYEGDLPIAGGVGEVVISSGEVFKKWVRE